MKTQFSPEAIEQFRKATEAMAAGCRALGMSSRMVDLIRDKARVFREYEQLHLAKGTDEGRAKAESNAAHAAELESIVRYVEPGSFE